MFNKLKQYKDLKNQANDLRKKLAEEVVTMESSAVKIVIDGNQDVKSVEISPEYLRPEKKNQLESELKDNMNKALKKIQRAMAMKMREMGGFNLPGMGGGDKE